MKNKNIKINIINWICIIQLTLIILKTMGGLNLSWLEVFLPIIASTLITTVALVPIVISKKIKDKKKKNNVYSLDEYKEKREKSLDNILVNEESKTIEDEKSIELSKLREREEKLIKFREILAKDATNSINSIEEGKKLIK